MTDLSVYFPFCSNISINSLPKFPSVLMGSATFSQSVYEDKLFSTFGVTRPESLNKAVVKRKSEFLAGRVLSGLVLRELGVTETEILIGKHRNPLWPEGVLGSISHASNTVLAAVALGGTISAIGIDVEEVISLETARNIHQSIVNDEELALMGQEDLSFGYALTIVFSAKESFFKAAYPSVGEYFDFDALRLVNLDLGSQSFTFRVARNLSPDFIENQMVYGHFSDLSSLVVTHIIV